MTQEEAEQKIIGVIEAQFDIHAMDPEDFAEMWVGIGTVLRNFAKGEITNIRSVCADVIEREARHRDSDDTATAAINEDLSVPKDCQARAGGIAREGSA